jgi:hypothetical protein
MLFSLVKFVFGKPLAVAFYGALGYRVALLP